MRERIRRMSGWISAFLVTVLVLVSAAGCGSGQGTGDIPARTEETDSLSFGESRTPASRACITVSPDGGSLSFSESRTPAQEAGTPGRDTFAVSGTEASAASETEALAVPGTEASAAPGTEESTDTGLTVEEGGSYTSKEEVALYLHLFGELPSNFITKKEAEALGWKKEPGEAGELQNVAPGKSIGGDRFGNYEKLLPEKEGRKYFECDINYVKGSRGAERIIYSNDGLVFYTGDHYRTFERLYP